LGKSSKPRKKHVPKLLKDGLITIMEINNILLPLEHMVVQLKQGELFVKNDVPVIKNWNNFICPAVPAILDWVNCFNRIAKGEGIQAEWKALFQLTISIQEGEDLTETLLNEAEAEINVCRSIMRRLTRSKFRSYITTEMIAIEQAALGNTTPD
jgi:hypothetical protein